ncbi:MAG: phosphoribosyltransferase family protein, partial [Candidatus Thiodiazotropha sp.]
GSHLVLVDDVITTGATVTELSKLLKKAGAKRIDVWAVARTPRS